MDKKSAIGGMTYECYRLVWSAGASRVAHRSTQDAASMTDTDDSSKARPNCLVYELLELLSPRLGLGSSPKKYSSLFRTFSAA